MVKSFSIGIHNFIHSEQKENDYCCCLSEFSSTEEKIHEKELNFILEEDKTLFDVLYLLKKQIKSESDSIYLNA